MTKREFLESAIASALDYSLLSEGELVAEVGLEALVECLEQPLRARLLAAMMTAPRIDEELIVRSIGVGELSESLPIEALWRVVAIAGARASGTSPELPQAPKRRAVRSSPHVVRRQTLADPESTRPVAVAEGTGRARKPNRRASGAGATSRRQTDAESEAMFVSSRKRSTSRAETEVAAPEDDVEDETEVNVELE